MAYIVLDNVKGGIDSTRMQEASAPGTLLHATNGVINRGGEFEKRKAWVSKYSLSTGETKGMQTASSTIYVFGSIAEGSLATAMPAGVTYQRLQHPGNASATISTILDSELYQGLPYVIAKFSDDSIFHFYNGSLVGSWADGVVRSDMVDNTGISSHLAGLIDASTKYTATAAGNTFDVTKVAKGTFTVATDADNVSGGTDDQTLTNSTVTPGVNPVSETLATGSFTISNGYESAGVYQVSTVLVNSVDVLDGTPVDFDTDAATTAINVVSQINSSSTSPDYNASASGATVTITADTGTGSSPNGFVVNPTSANKVIGIGSISHLSGGVDEVLATGSIEISGGVGGDTIDSITVNGVDILGTPVAWTSSDEQTAANVQAQIDSYTSSPNYSANNTGAVITIQAAALSGASPNGFVVSGSATGTVSLINASNMSGGVDRVQATGSFQITRGVEDVGTVQITSVTVDGVEVLSGPVDWVTNSTETANDVANNISANVSSPDYDATNSTNTVTIQSSLSGTAANGRQIAVTVSPDAVTYSGINNMGGGVNAVTGVSQVERFTVGGTFEIGDQFNVNLDGEDFGFSGNPTNPGITALTFGKKMYTTASKILHFSEIDDPTAFFTLLNGGGFIDISTEASQLEDLTGIGKYQNYLAVFSRNETQVWQVFADDANNSLLQNVENTGTFANKSIVSVGDLDIYFLSDTGVRSLKARDSSNVPFVSDVGTAIDTYILEYMDTLTDAQKEAAVAAADPRDGRYLLSIHENTYVHSRFPANKISAWTQWNGLQITEYGRKSGKLFARAGDTIYLYGGDNNDQYDDDITATLQTPFLYFQSPATKKQLKGIDIVCEGKWYCKIFTDPRDPDGDDAFIEIGEIDGTTTLEDAYPVEGCGPYFSVHLQNINQAGAARVSQIILHYDDGPAS